MGNRVEDLSGVFFAFMRIRSALDCTPNIGANKNLACDDMEAHAKYLVR